MNQGEVSKTHPEKQSLMTEGIKCRSFDGPMSNILAEAQVKLHSRHSDEKPTSLGGKSEAGTTSKNSTESVSHTPKKRKTDMLQTH